MKSNDYQIGGTHYQKLEYQPWDLCVDLDLDFLTAGVIKYVARWRSKNGLQDLEKALHYISKKSEVEKYNKKKYNTALVNRFCAQLETYDAGIIHDLLENKNDTVKAKLNLLINKFKTESNYMRG